MASLGPTTTEITLAPHYGTSSNNVSRPTATLCAVCRKEYKEHAPMDFGPPKCLFEATVFQQEDLLAYKQRFDAWMAGQRLEDCLASIAYAITKVSYDRP